MTRKFISMALVVSMLLCIFCGFISNNSLTTNINVDGYNITVEENQTTKTTSTIVEGVPMKCERNLTTDEYLLYINDSEPIQLEVTLLDDTHIAISDVSDNADFSNTEVIGQYVLTLSLAVPSFISAAKLLVCAAASVTLTSYICVSANAIGNVIGGIRSNSKTYYRYRAVDVDAATAIRYGKMDKYNTYYEAYLNNNTVYVGQEISRWAAVSRLECGYDVFATSEFAALYVCIAATTSNNRNKTLIRHTNSGEGYYPHIHPLGRHWYKNYTSAPHCWYPY